MIHDITQCLADPHDNFSGPGRPGLLYMPHIDLSEEQKRLVSDEIRHIYESTDKKLKEAAEKGEKADLEDIWFGDVGYRLQEIRRFEFHPNAYGAYCFLEESGYSDTFTDLMANLYDQGKNTEEETDFETH